MLSTGVSLPVVITQESVNLEYNNSVGNEWSTRATVNGTMLMVGESVAADLENGAVLKAEAMEQDTYVDTGQAENTIWSYDLICAGENVESCRVLLDVVVTEDRGAYAVEILHCGGLNS